MPSRQTLAALAVLGAAFCMEPALADAQTKRSGTVVAIDVDQRTLTLEEMGVAGQPQRHLVTLDPSVRVVEVLRRGEGGEAEGPGAWPGGFREMPARYLAPGDFVTITFDDGRASVARSIDIVRTDEGGDTAAASPPSAVELPPRR